MPGSEIFLDQRVKPYIIFLDLAYIPSQRLEHVTSAPAVCDRACFLMVSPPNYADQHESVARVSSVPLIRISFTMKVVNDLFMCLKAISYFLWPACWYLLPMLPSYCSSISSQISGALYYLMALPVHDTGLPMVVFWICVWWVLPTWVFEMTPDILKTSHSTWGLPRTNLHTSKVVCKSLRSCLWDSVKLLQLIITQMPPGSLHHKPIQSESHGRRRARLGPLS